MCAPDFHSTLGMNASWNSAGVMDEDVSVVVENDSRLVCVVTSRENSLFVEGMSE